MPDRKLLPDLGLRQPSQRQIQVVAAEQQVFADSGAGELDLVALACDLDEGKVRGAAANVANQHDLAIEQQPPRPCKVVRDPRIECCGRLLDQRQLGETRLRCRLHRQFACFLVERLRYGEHYIHVGQVAEPAGLVPSLADRRNQSGGNLHRGKNPTALAGVPGQDLRVPVHIRIREPGLGAVH